MDNRTLAVLEYPKIIAIISDFSATEPGRNAVKNLSPLKDVSEIVSVLETITEIREINAVEGRIPFSGTSDIDSLLGKIKVEGSFLTPHEISTIGSNISAQRRVRSFLSPLSNRCPRIAGIADPIINLKHLEEDIESVVASLWIETVRRRGWERHIDDNALIHGIGDHAKNLDIVRCTVAVGILRRSQNGIITGLGVVDKKVT